MPGGWRKLTGDVLGGGSAATLGIALAIAAFVATLAAALEAPTWLTVAAAVAVMVAAIGVEISKHRREQAIDALERQSKIARKVQSDKQRTATLESSIAHWPPPPLSSLAPQDLGVLPADKPMAAAVKGNAYIERDADTTSLQKLRRSGRILLIGTPGSGVTRSAFELARKSAGRTAVVVVPHAPRGLIDACAQGYLDEPAQEQLMFWLDRIDRYSDGEALAKLLVRLRQENPGAKVIATISTTAVRQWRLRASQLSDFFVESTLYESDLSADETARARHLYPHQPIDTSLRATFSSFTFIGDRVVEGFLDCPHESAGEDCATARSIVKSVVAWSLTGSPRPVPENMLRALVTRRSGDVDDDHYGDALAWATSLVTGNLSLVDVVDGERGRGYGAEVRLVEFAAEGDLVSCEHYDWLAACNEASDSGDFDAVGRIGFTAYTSGANVIAVDVFETLRDIHAASTPWLRSAMNAANRGRDSVELRFAKKLHTLAAARFGADSVEAAEELMAVAGALASQRNYGEAVSTFDTVITIMEPHGETSSLALALGLRAAAQQSSGQPIPAIADAERSMDMSRRLSGERSRDFTNSLSVKGAILSSMGFYADAAECFQRLIEIERQQDDPVPSVIASNLQSLAKMRLAQRQFPAAVALLREALTLFEDTAHDVLLDIAECRRALSSALIELHQYDPAIRESKLALSILNRRFGAESPELIHTLLDLSAAYRGKQELPVAQEYCDRAEVIDRRANAGNITEPNILSYSAAIAFERRDFRRSLGLMQEGLRKAEKQVGPWHPSLVVLLSNIGAACEMIDDRRRARDAYSRALQIADSNFGPDFPMRRAILQSLARCE